MSLVITSSSKNEDDKTSRRNVGIENPASYQNFLKSPLIIEPDTEVALVSLKCSRDSDKVEVKKGDGLFVYWGAENSQNMNDGTEGSEKPTESDDINAPLRVELREGTYTRKMFASHLQTRLEEVLTLAYREISTITVSQVFDGSNVFTGFKIQIVQVGDGSAFTDKPSASEFGPYIDKDTYYRIGGDDKFTEDDEVTDSFVASASGTDVLITGYKADSVGAVCDVIGHAHPLSQVKSKCVIYFNGSSGATEDDGYTLGLVRSQGRTVNSEKRNYGAVGVYGELLDADNYSDSVNIPEFYVDAGGGDTPPFFWDVAFNWKPGFDGQVIHFVNDGEEDDTRPLMDTITLQTTPTNASLQAKFWEAVVFEVTGEKMDVKLKQTGKEVYDTLVSSASTTFGERVKPIGMTCNQLYPKIAIHNNDATNPGTAWLTTYNGHANLSYYENNYFGYTTERNGDVPMDIFTTTANNIDLSSVYANGKKSDGSTDYVYKGELTGNRGIDNKWVFLSGDYEETYGEDNEYFNNHRQITSLEDDGRLQNILGFDAIMTQTDFGASVDHGADISFSSPNEPSFIPTTSMFVRLKNMAINTFNANKQSISNIIYSCPKFDAQGNTGGLLFYEPAERVYVKLNNVDKQVVNSLDVDIVDVNEKIIDNLVGNTLAVLHFRKSK